MIGLNRIGTSFLLSLLFLAAPWSSARAQPEDEGGSGVSSATATSNAAGNCGDFSASGPPACNGTSEPAEVTVSTTSTVQLTVGSKVFGVGVSEAHQASYSQTLEPGECIAIKYNFDCCKMWYGWSCHSTGTELVSA